MHRPTNHTSKTKAQRENVLALLLLCAAAGLWIGRPILRQTPESTAGAPAPAPPSPFKINGIPTATPPKMKGASVRRIYGHSLVAGGIRSVDELMAVIQKDPRLAEHYKNF